MSAVMHPKQIGNAETVTSILGKTPEECAEHIPTNETRAAVKALAVFGTPQDQIAKYLRISPKTLRRHYRDELDRSKLDANMAVAKRLYEHATTDSVPAAIFWMKTLGGLAERDILKHEGLPAGMGPTVNLTLHTRSDTEKFAAQVLLDERDGPPAIEHDEDLV